MSPIIEIRPSLGEKPFEPKKVTVSLDTIIELAADLPGLKLLKKTVGRDYFPKSDPQVEAEKDELQSALVDVARNS